MKIINTDGMAFIGPGSEWFWTALSGLVLAVTFLGIYRQLSIARSANAFEQMNRITSEFSSERITRYKLDVLVALRNGTDPADVPNAAAGSVADFWEDMATLVRAGHVDRRLLYENLGSQCQRWWAALAPFQRRTRIERGDPRLGEHFEWLASVMAEMDRNVRADVPPYDYAYLASTFDKAIQTTLDEIHMAEELRAVIVRPMSSATPPSAAQHEAAPAGPLA